MFQNYIANNIFLLKSPLGGLVSTALWTGTVNEAVGLTPTSTSGAQMIIDAQDTVLVSIDASLYDSVDLTLCTPVAFTYVASTVSTSIPSDALSVPLPFSWKVGSDICVSSRVLVPPLGATESQNQYFGIAFVGSNTNAKDISYSMRAHLEDIKFFQPMK
jgi:hypothetical protein